ncbi:alpha/beta hydrolase family protein [Flavobacteriaceae bacterium M23B6Z8]
MTILLVISGIFSYGQEALSTKLIPTEVLYKKNKFSNYMLSPDGKYFVEVMENNISYDIIVIDVEGHRMFSRIPMGDEPISGLSWLTSRRMAYEKNGLIYAIDADGTNSSVIVDNVPDKPIKNARSLLRQFKYNSLLDILPTEEDEILVETYDYKGYGSVYRVNIFTGEKRIIKDGARFKINKWLTDHQGTPKLGLRFEEEKIVYCGEDPDTREWEPFKVHLNGQQYPLTIDPTVYLDQKISFEGFSPEKDVIYLATNVDTDRRILVSYDLKKMRILETLAEDVNCDISDPLNSKARFIFNYDYTELLGINYHGINPQYKWFSQEMADIKAKIDRLNPEYINDVFEVDKNLQNILLYNWNDDKPGKISVYNVKDSVFSVMLDINAELESYRMSKTKNVIIKARDDYKLQAYLNLPTQQGVGRDSLAPLVVLPHGGPWTRDYWEFDQSAQYFANRGYAALRVNYRGSTGFGKEHVLAGVNNIDQVMIDDLADSVKHIISNYAVDPNRVFIFGHSYGGYAGYMSIIRYPELYNAAVVLSAPTDLKTWMKNRKKEKDLFAYEFWQTALGSKDRSYYEKISPINYVDRINNPLLIFHGKYDEIIPVEQSERLVEKLKEANKEVKLSILQKEMHSIWDSNSIGYILEQANEFFKEHRSKKNIPSVSGE